MLLLGWWLLPAFSSCQDRTCHSYSASGSILWLLLGFEVCALTSMSWLIVMCACVGVWSSSLFLAFWLRTEGFVSNKSLNVAWFIFPSILTSAPYPTEEKQPQSITLPPPCSAVDMAFLGWPSVLALLKHTIQNQGKTLTTFSHMVSGDWMIFLFNFLASFKCACIAFIHSFEKWLLPPY